MNKLELTSLNCTNCGATVTGYENKNEVTCDYCGTLIKIIRPKEVLITNQNLSKESQDRLNNYVEILQKAMRAGNYKEGYEYCNKALELDPSIGALWENKAICAFWQNVSLIGEDKVSETDAREIITYLKASKENDPDSQTYVEVADSIGYNLGLITQIKYAANIYADEAVKGEPNSFSRMMLIKAKRYHELMEISFEIMENKDTRFLEFVVDDLSNLKNITWSFGESKQSDKAKSINYDTFKKRDLIIKIIQKYKPDYNPPKIKVFKFPYAVIIVVSIVIGLFFAWIISSM